MCHQIYKTWVCLKMMIKPMDMGFKPTVFWGWIMYVGKNGRYTVYIYIYKYIYITLYIYIIILYIYIHMYNCTTTILILGAHNFCELVWKRMIKQQINRYRTLILTKPIDLGIVKCRYRRVGSCSFVLKKRNLGKDETVHFLKV